MFFSTNIYSYKAILCLRSIRMQSDLSRCGNVPVVPSGEPPVIRVVIFRSRNAVTEKLTEAVVSVNEAQRHTKGPKCHSHLSFVPMDFYEYSFWSSGTKRQLTLRRMEVRSGESSRAIAAESHTAMKKTPREDRRSLRSPNNNNNNRWESFYNVHNTVELAFCSEC